MTLSACGGDGGEAVEPTNEQDTGTDSGSPPDAGPDIDSDSPDGGTELEPVICTPDSRRIAAASRCLSDDHCPCGSFCDLGKCVASCLEDTDCADGERCDDFGRCRGADETAMVPAPPEAAGGRLAVEESSLFMPADADQTALRVRITERDAARVRLASSGSAEIDCGDGFGTECILEQVAAGTLLEIPVRHPAAGEPGSDELGQIAIFTDSAHSFVTIRREAAPTQPTLGSLTLEGVYEGIVVAREVGTGLLGDPGEAPSSALEFPLTAEVFGDGEDAILQIDDTYGALNPAGQLIGQFALADDDGDGRYDGTVDFPSHLALEGELTPGAQFQVLTETGSADVSVSGTPTTINISLVQRYTGMLADDEAPQVRWQILLVRKEGPSGATAPDIPADATRTVTGGETAASLPTPWEVSLLHVNDRYTPNSYNALGRAQLAQQWRRAGRSGGSLRVCALSDFERELLAAQLLDDEMGLPDRLDSYTVYGMANSPGMPILNAVGTSFLDIGLYNSDVILGSLSAPLDQVGGPFSMACAVSIDDGYSSASGCATGSQSWTLDADKCSEMSNSYGCYVETVSASVALSGGGTLRRGSNYCGSAYTEGTMSVTKVCKWPPMSPRCAELASCVNAQPGSSITDLDSSLLGASVLESSGDALCETGGRAAAFAADVNAALELSDPDRAGLGEVFDTCLADIGRMQAAAPASVPKYGNGLDQIFDESVECVDPVRAFIVASMALDTARSGSDLTRHRYEFARHAIGQRMLQRWLLLHAFLAEEAVQREQMADVFRGAGVPGQPDPVELPVVMDAGLQQWAMIFHPRIAVGLGRSYPGALADTDFRDMLGGAAPLAGDEIGVGLPVAMLESLDSHMELIDAHLSKRARALQPSAADDFRQALPFYIIGRALAFGLHKKAADYEPNLVWQDRYAGAEKALSESAAKAFATARAVSEGANPLGIDESDLPLYFFGDTTGAGGRFSAISDFLIGAMPGDTAWAPVLVDRARDALSDARDAFIAQHDRAYRERMDATAHQAHLDAVRDKYNAELQDFCGPSVDAAIDDADFNASSCFIDRERSECRSSLYQHFNQFTENDWRGQFCVGQKIRDQFGDSYGFSDEDVQRIAEAQCESFQVSDTCPDGADACVDCIVGGDIHDTIGLSLSSFRLDTPPLAVYTNALDTPFWNMAHPDHKRMQLVEQLFDECRHEHAPVRLHIPFRDSEMPADCLHGSLGEAAQEVITAGRDVQIAVREVAEFQESYDIAMTSCALLHERDEDVAAATEKHNTNMDRLRTLKLRADQVATAAAAVKECAATTAAADTNTPWSAAKGAAATTASCAAGVAEAGSTIASLEHEATMEAAIAAHEADIAGIEASANYEICKNDARQELVGEAAALIRLEQAQFDQLRALNDLMDLMLAAQGTHQKGLENLERASRRAVRPAAGDVWVDEKVSTYVRRMRLARRAVYLGLRAVEYEYQQTLAARADVLQAETPDQLEAVLDDLWTSAGTRTVAGNRPTDLQIVLSLRDDILRLSDERTQPAGMQTLTPQERLRLMLQSQQYAVYDDEGSYVGQQIPFSLAPLEAMGLDPEGVSIYAATDCAERLWSVNASIIGSDDVFEGSDTSFARIDLLKQNVFFSQWCGESADGQQPYQVASVRPSRNLFREPGVGAEVGSSISGAGETQMSSRARIQAFFNVDRAEFSRDDYANGDTSELAARGLYGKYALFFPKGVLSSEDAQGNRSRGLVLDRVDDVLLRLDYVSVAK